MRLFRKVEEYFESSPNATAQKSSSNLSLQEPQVPVPLPGTQPLNFQPISFFFYQILYVSSQLLSGLTAFATMAVLVGGVKWAFDEGIQFPQVDGEELNLIPTLPTEQNGNCWASLGMGSALSVASGSLAPVVFGALGCIPTVSAAPINLQNVHELRIPFDGNGNDISGHNRHAELVGVTYTQDRFGQNNKAAYFSGVGSKGRVPFSIPLKTLSFYMSSDQPARNLSIEVRHMS